MSTNYGGKAITTMEQNEELANALILIIHFLLVVNCIIRKMSNDEAFSV